MAIFREMMTYRANRILSYILLPIAIVLHIAALVMASSTGFKVYLGGALALAVSLLLNMRSPLARREELFWLPAIGCIVLSVITLVLYVIGVVLKVFLGFTG
jgi:hypothetical protein